MPTLLSVTRDLGQVQVLHDALILRAINKLCSKTDCLNQQEL